MKVFKAQGTSVSLYDLSFWFYKNGLAVKSQFCISWKVGKRRKIRRYTILHWSEDDCESCGGYTRMGIGNTISSQDTDNHFGSGMFHLNP